MLDFPHHNPIRGRFCVPLQCALVGILKFVYQADHHVDIGHLTLTRFIANPFHYKKIASLTLEPNFFQIHGSLPLMLPPNLRLRALKKTTLYDIFNVM